MKKILSAFVVSIVSLGLFLSFTTSGCGFHKRPTLNLAVIDSSTSSTVPTSVVILIQQPSPFDQTVILNEILAELRSFNETEQVVNVTVEIDNNIEIDASVDVDIEGNKIIVRPGKQRTVPNLYHWLKKFQKKKCKRSSCHERPKPCDNES